MPIARAVERLGAVPTTAARNGQKVNLRGDAGEREAERAAAWVTGGGGPAASALTARTGGIESSATGIGGGTPLPATVRAPMESRFGTSFARIRVHTDAAAQRAAASLRARAFTRGHEIFFGSGEYDPSSEAGRRVIAHELAHSIQQGAVPRPSSSLHGMPPISERTEGVTQRLSLSDLVPSLDGVRQRIAERANVVPGFRALTLALGRNPITGTSASRSPAELLRALLELVPGGAAIVLALDRYGMIDSAGAWLAEQLAELRSLGATVDAAIRRFLGGLDLSDALDLGAVWEHARAVIAELVAQVGAFVRTVASGLLRILREAILDPLAERARSFQGYDFLCAVLGHDPLSGRAVPRNAESLLGGALRMIGQAEVWENMRRANAVDRAFAWFRGAVEAIGEFAAEVPRLVHAMIERLTPADLLNLPGVVGTVAGIFGRLAARFTSWAGHALWELLEILVDSISPGALAYIRRTGAALRSILQNPLPFMRNLIRAAREGFERFATNLPAHLRTGLIGWLTGTLAGVHIPNALTYAEVVRFILSVLNLSWASVRTKLVTAVGEPTVAALERGFDVVQTLVRDGPAAAWERIREQLSELRETLFDGIQSFVVETVMARAIPRLVAMFVPGAGFITAVLSIYDTVATLVDRFARMVHVVRGFVDSIAAIATGSISAAAGRVEASLASALTLAIELFAGFVGLRRVGDRVRAIIERLRAPVDRALDAVVRWVVDLARHFIASARTAIRSIVDWAFSRRQFTTGDGQTHTIFAEDGSESPQLMIASTPTLAKAFLSAWLAEQSVGYKRTHQAKISEIEQAIIAAGPVLRTIANLSAGRQTAAARRAGQELIEINTRIANGLRLLLGTSASFDSAETQYLLEGLTGTYQSMPKPTGDRFEADHQPQAAVLVGLAAMRKLASRRKLQQVAENRAARGVAINLNRLRHREGRTYGPKGVQTRSDFLTKAASIIARESGEDLYRTLSTALRKEAQDDSKEIIRALDVDSAWDDLSQIGLPRTRERTLKTKIREQVRRGQSEVLRQNFEALFE